jgi:hypothetical protein
LVFHIIPCKVLLILACILRCIYPIWHILQNQLAMKIMKSIFFRDFWHNTIWRWIANCHLDLI